MREREREREKESLPFQNHLVDHFHISSALNCRMWGLKAVYLLLLFLVLNDKIHSIVSIHSVVKTFIHQYYKVTNGEFKGQISKTDIHIM